MAEAEMTKLQSPTPDNTTIPTVTTAEASSAETTKTETSRQQPQAVTMATDITSFSTVHVQQSTVFPKMRSLHLTHSTSEPAPSNPRKMLVRSTAVRSTSSPPLPPEDSNEVMMQYVTTNTSFESSQSFDSGIVSEFPSRTDIAGRTSKQNSFSRDNSFEYTDSTGTDLNDFIIKTLRNPRDRKFVMKLEHDFLNFIQDPLTIYINYPPMTSYHRMIVHRVAAYFGMDHNVDQQTGKSVIINKSINTRIPEQRFGDLVSLSREESEDSEGAMPKSILRRQNTPSGDDSTPPKVDSPIMMMHGGMERSKSIEEREEEYVKARQRIFNNPGSRQSSLSSQSSKGDMDMPHPQILTREEAEFLQHGLPKVTPPRIPRSRSFDDRTMDKHALTGPGGVRIMSNKMFTRSSSSPGRSVAAAYAAAEYPHGAGSPKSIRQQAMGVPAGGIQYWTPEGVPVIAAGMPAGEVMVQAQPGMVPVMAPTNPGAQSGGMMWSVSPETVPHGIMLINPTTGTPALGPDGNPIIVQQAYQQMVMKPGNNQRYPLPQQKQQQQQPVPSQQSVTGPYQQGGVMGQQQQQMMMPPQYVGMQQPVYMMQQGRPPFTQPQMGSENQPMSPSYQEMSGQFAALAVSGQQQEMDPSIHQQMMNEDSSASPSPLYATSMSQASMPGQLGQVQYVMVPHQGMHPQQLGSMNPGQPGSPQMVPPQGPAAQQAYVVAAQPSYPQAHYHQQYNKDIPIAPHARSQTPPTPPQSSSPVLAQAYNPQKVQMSAQSSQQSRNAAPFRQQHTPPQTPSQVMQPMMPVVLSGNRAIPLGTAMVPNAFPGQGPSPHSTGMALPYQQPQVQVQSQYLAGPKKGIDRRQPKSSEIYPPEMMGVALPGAPMGQIPVMYAGGEPVSIMHMDRNQYAQYAQHRYGHVPVVGNPGFQYQPYSKHKTKQHHKKSQSPRSSSQSEQGQVERQSSSKSSDSESPQGNVLEVYDLPSEIKNYGEDVLFEDLKTAGAQIEWPTEGTESQNTTVRAVFPSPSAAEQALSLVSNQSYKLRYPAATNTHPGGTTAAAPSNP